MMMITQIQARARLRGIKSLPTAFAALFSNICLDSEISDVSDVGEDDETILDRITALQDIVPPQARAKISSVSSTIMSATSTGINYGGKGLWILVTSVLLLGLPYALALGDEQQIQEEERQRMLMQEGAQGLINPGEGEAKAAL